MRLQRNTKEFGQSWRIVELWCCDNMGLNDFVSLFYGSAQSLHTSSGSATKTAVDVLPPSVGGSEFKTKTLEMLKNHKNSKLPKLNEYSAASDKKFSRNMTLTSMKPPQQKGIRCGGIGIGIAHCDGLSKSSSGDICGSGGGSGSGKNVSDKKYRTLGKSSSHTSSSCYANANAPAAAAPTASPPVPSSTSLAISVVPSGPVSTTTSSTTTVVVKSSSSGSEMDLFKAPGSLRKKSSFLWNSFRMPRKQKGGESRVIMMITTTTKLLRRKKRKIILLL